MKDKQVDKMMRKLTGCTLMELMVVMAIVAIVASIATPPLLRWRTDAKLRGAASNLRGDLELAKMRAIRENSFVAVLFSDSNYSIFVDNGASAGDWIQDADDRQLRNRQLPAGVNLIMPTSFTNDRTRFTGRGHCSPGATVVKNSKAAAIRVSVNRLGGISLKKE